MSLIVEDVTHRYRGRAEPVLHGVSLVVEPSDSLALMGPSGSGKTTLLGVLGLLFQPSEGRVLIDGHVVSGRSMGRLRVNHVAWIFQSTNALSRRTAAENAALGLLARGAAPGEALDRARSALRSVGIDSLADQPANTLSGGELQRVCIARALASGPRFVFADEPTGQLDSATTRIVINALLKNRPPNSSIVIATHDPEVARQCDRIVWIRDGQLLERLP